MTPDTPWDPNQYLIFSSPRLRPAIDLIARIPTISPATIIDLGCGAGNVTRLLEKRWPNAAISGVDMSREMLEQAKQEVENIQLFEADLTSWAPKQAADLVFSNAVLQWVPNHSTLLPRIAGFVSSGGVLAVQIPHNNNAPFLKEIEEVVRTGPWVHKLDTLQRPTPAHNSDFYYKTLSSLGFELDVWETEYHHVLEGKDPVLEWGKGTWLRV